jgi:hypothetical protein
MTKLVEARAFAIWRYASARYWDVSYEEVSEATGVGLNQVAQVITLKGWGGRIGKGRSRRGTSATAAKGHRTKGHSFDENSLDLWQLIGEET